MDKKDIRWKQRLQSYTKALNYHTVKEPTLIDHMDRIGIEWYSR
ncbi:MAG TPA: hypothetical protein VKX33_03115 [Cyclobacteriaceae bacterium]|nr:hypothetical protein [Cyclobacteriaceae bacterium]